MLNPITTGIAAVASLLLLWQLHSMRVDYLKRQHLDALNAAISTQQEQCRDAQALTERTADELRREMSDNRQRHDAIVKRLREQGTRIVPVAVPSIGIDGAAAREVSGTVGIDAIEMTGIMRECDDLSDTVKGWQKFYGEVRNRAY